MTYFERPIKNLLYLLFITLSLSSLSLYGDSEEPLLVERLVIEAGNPELITLDEYAVRARLKTKEGDFFSQSFFDEDLKTLATEYHRVEPDVKFKSDSVVIKLRVWPKPIIRKLHFVGNKKVKDKSLKSELGIDPQSVFDQKKFTEGFHKLQALYVKKGFFEAELRYEVENVEGSNEVDVSVHIEEGRAGKIQSIVFLNLNKEEESELSKMLLTKKFHFINSLLSDDGTYNPDKVDQDRLIVTDFLHNRGYPDARVEIRVKEARSSKRIILEIDADKGERYTFGRVTFEGNTVFDDQKICSLLTIEEGDVFSPQKLRNSSQGIQLLYGRKGYVDAFVAYEPSLNPQTNCYDIHFRITESQRYRVGLIKVFGNDCTDTEVILHETLLVPGDVFNMEKLRSTERRLQNIGYFEHVNVYAVKSAEAELIGQEFRDIYIEVEEQSTGSFNFSAGYSSTDRLFGSFAITEKNFCIRNLPLVLQEGYQAVRGGGEYFFIRTNAGDRSKSIYTSWAKPHFYDTPWTVGLDFDLGKNRARAKNYDTRYAGGSAFGKYTINQFLRGGLHFRVRRSSVSDIPATASTALQDEKNNAGTVTAIGASLVYNSSNHPVMPTQGLRSELFLEYAGFGGKHEFISLAYLNTIYIPVWKRFPHLGIFPSCLYDGILRLRGDMRFKKPLGDSTISTLPLDERFFLGGEGTVRGYRPYSIGPQYVEGDPSGGISSWLYSVEYNQPLFACFEAFTFIEGGHLSAQEFHLGRFDSSYGFGARIAFSQSMPPLTVGLGFPIDLQRERDKQSFFFSMAGRF